MVSYLFKYSTFNYYLNTLRPRQDGRQFPDSIFKCIFLNENALFLITTNLKFVPKGPINNIPALVQIMVWCQQGDNPLSEPMMDRSLTHICVTLPQWVNICYLCVINKIYWCIWSTQPPLLIIHPPSACLAAMFMSLWSYKLLPQQQSGKYVKLKCSWWMMDEWAEVM